MDELLAKLMAQAEQAQEDNVKLIRVGRVSTQLLEKTNEISDKERAAVALLKKDINAYVEEMRIVVQREVNKLEEVFFETNVNKDRELVWEEIFDELGLPDEIREDVFSINRNTGVVSREVSLEDAKKEASKSKVKVINISTGKK